MLGGKRDSQCDEREAGFPNVTIREEGILNVIGGKQDSKFDERETGFSM